MDIAKREELPARLALPPSGGVNAAMIFGHLRRWQDAGASLVEMEHDDEGKLRWWRWVPTKEELDEEIAMEKKMWTDLWQQI